jgi:hypothetical protein
MNKEKIYVARNSEPGSSPSQYLGAEVSIGLLSVDDIERLKSILDKDELFEEFGGSHGESYIGSDFLTDLMDYNELYHKNGLIFYEDIFEETYDSNEYSSDNWSIGSEEMYNPFNSKYKETKDPDLAWEKNKDYIAPKTISIPQDKCVVVSVRTMDLYFKASGDFPDDGKLVFDETGISKYKVQMAVDSFNNLLYNAGFGGFQLLHSAFVNGQKLERDEDAETEAGNIYYSSHLIYKDGMLVAWLATNNEDHTFPFDYVEGDINCISPNTREYDNDTYKSAIKSLIEIL